MAIASVVTTTSWYSPPLVPGSCSRKPWNPYPKSLSIRFNARRGRLKLRAQRSLALDAEKEWENGRTVDVAVIGAGIGGLCCAAMLAKYGLSVVVCESHDTAGGAAHAFIRQGFHFDSGPSFHAGLSTKPSINPLKQVLDAIDEQVQCVQYDTWIGYFPEGIFKFTADKAAYAAEITRVGGQKAGCEWKELERAMEPFSRAAASLPAAALRQDLGVLLTVGRFLPRLLPYIPYTGSLLAPFSDMVDKIVKDPFLRKLIDLECFVLSGLLADGHAYCSHLAIGGWVDISFRVRDAGILS